MNIIYYHAFYYGYVAYKAYEYSSIAEFVCSTGRQAKRVYDWAVTTPDNVDRSAYLDWILVEDTASPLIRPVKHSDVFSSLSTLDENLFKFEEDSYQSTPKNITISRNLDV